MIRIDVADRAPLSRRETWTLAARPKTLPAALTPVITGMAVAFVEVGEDGIHWLSAVLALVTALLLQIAANFANDALDFRRGADTVERLGPVRVTATGRVSSRAMLRATALVLLLATATGLPLAIRGGWPMFLIGAAAIVCAVAYTGGPFPLGYLGLGEVFVFVFFGLVGVAGTAYVQTRDLTGLALAASVPIGALAVAILVVNNLRDLRTDAQTGKRTLAVRVGERLTRWEYKALVLIALATPPILWSVGWLGWWWLITLVWLPVAGRLWSDITVRSGKQLNATLADTGKGLLLYGLLLSCALVLSV